MIVTRTIYLLNLRLVVSSWCDVIFWFYQTQTISPSRTVTFRINFVVYFWSVHFRNASFVPNGSNPRSGCSIITARSDASRTRSKLSRLRHYWLNYNFEEPNTTAVCPLHRQYRHARTRLLVLLGTSLLTTTCYLLYKMAPLLKLWGEEEVNGRSAFQKRLRSGISLVIHGMTPM